MIIILNLAVIAFHLLVLTGIIPFNIVWGGRLEAENEMYIFESVSILINLLLVLTVLIKINRINAGAKHKMVNAILWVFVILFVLNTIGNLTSETTLETYIATPLTLLLACLCARVALERLRN